MRKTFEVIFAVLFSSEVVNADLKDVNVVQSAEINVGETLLVRIKGTDVKIMISSASKQEVGVIVRRHDKPCVQLVTTERGVSTSVYYTDADGTFWEVLDVEGCGIPRYRKGVSGPGEGKAQKFIDGKWTPMKKKESQ